MPYTVYYVLYSIQYIVYSIHYIIYMISYNQIVGYSSRWILPPSDIPMFGIPY